MTDPTAKDAAVAAPAPAPAAPAPAAPARKAVAFGKQSFKETNAQGSAIDRMKAYLKDIPVIHGRLNKFVADQEAQLAAAKKSLAEFDAVTAQLKATVAKWEEEQSHGGPGHDVPDAAAGSPAVADPTPSASPAGGGTPGATA